MEELNDPNVAAALRSCHLRGWVEVLTDAVPSDSLNEDGTLPGTLNLEKVAPLYRLTDAGWNAIHRTQGWIVATFIVAFASFIAVLLSKLL